MHPATAALQWQLSSKRVSSRGGCAHMLCWSLSRVWLFEAPWTVARQGPLSMEISRREYWSGLPFPSPGDLPDPGTEPGSPALLADSLPSEPWCTLVHSYFLDYSVLFKKNHQIDFSRITLNKKKNCPIREHFQKPRFNCIVESIISEEDLRHVLFKRLSMVCSLSTLDSSNQSEYLHAVSLIFFPFMYNFLVFS